MWSLRSYLGNIYLNLDDLILSWLVIVATVYICDFFRELVLFGGRFQLDIFYRYPVAEIIGTVEATVIAFEVNFISMVQIVHKEPEKLLFNNISTTTTTIECIISTNAYYSLLTSS